MLLIHYVRVWSGWSHTLHSKISSSTKTDFHIDSTFTLLDLKYFNFNSTFVVLSFLITSLPLNFFFKLVSMRQKYFHPTRDYWTWQTRYCKIVTLPTGTEKPRQRRYVGVLGGAESSPWLSRARWNCVCSRRVPHAIMPCYRVWKPWGTAWRYWPSVLEASQYWYCHGLQYCNIGMATGKGLLQDALISLNLLLQHLEAPRRWNQQRFCGCRGLLVPVRVHMGVLSLKGVDWTPNIEASTESDKLDPLQRKLVSLWR